MDVHIRLSGRVSAAKTFTEFIVKSVFFDANFRKYFSQKCLRLVCIYSSNRQRSIFVFQIVRLTTQPSRQNAQFVYFAFLVATSANTKYSPLQGR